MHCLSLRTNSVNVSVLLSDINILMTDKLKASFSPRSNNALNLDALQLLKASSTNLQLNKMASNKQIPMLNSFI